MAGAALVGSTAVDLLLGAAEGETVVAERVLYRPELVARASTRGA